MIPQNRELLIVGVSSYAFTFYYYKNFFFCSQVDKRTHSTLSYSGNQVDWGEMRLLIASIFLWPVFYARNLFSLTYNYPYKLKFALPSKERRNKRMSRWVSPFYNIYICKQILDLERNKLLVKAYECILLITTLYVLFSVLLHHVST